MKIKHVPIRHYLKVGITFLLVLMAAISRAQLVVNGGFDVINCNVTDENPFFSGCVPSWHASHGSPQIKGVPSDQYAYMWAQDNIGEGIFTELPALIPNKQYELAFTARGFNSPNLAVKIASNLKTGTEATGEHIPRGINVLWEQAFFPNLSWNLYIARFTVTAPGPYQLWFYPETSNSSSKREVHINDVSFDDVDCLTRTILYQNSSTLPALTRTQGSILAGNSVSPFLSTGPVRILAGQDVFYGATQEVVLLDGFSAEGGSTFSAYYVGGGCAASYQHPLINSTYNGNTQNFGSNKKESKDVDTKSVLTENTLQVSPNPFINKLAISYYLTGNNSKASIEVFSATGIKVASLAQGKLPADGTHILEWDAGSLPGGIYLMVLTTDNGKLVRKVIKK